MSKSVICENIGKNFTKDRSKPALKEINIEVETGSLFGLIGPDGAGKTSLFRILTTLIKQDVGTAIIEGLDTLRDYRQIRRISGYMPGRFSLYQDLSVKENLEFFATIFDSSLEDNYELIKDIYQQIEAFRDRRAGALSGGMKQKLALCCALIHRPKILFLDEPTTGVDAVSRKEFWQMLHRLKDQGITIMVSTPYMDEASLCDKIALIQNGLILSTNTPADLIASFPKRLWAIRSDQMYALLNALQSWPEVASVHSFGSEHHVSFLNPRLTENEILDYLRSGGHGQVILNETEPSVEDCFLEFLTKESIA